MAQRRGGPSFPERRHVVFTGLAAAAGAVVGSLGTVGFQQMIDKFKLGNRVTYQGRQIERFPGATKTGLESAKNIFSRLENVKKWVTFDEATGYLRVQGVDGNVLFELSPERVEKAEFVFVLWDGSDQAGTLSFEYLFKDKTTGVVHVSRNFDTGDFDVLPRGAVTKITEIKKTR